MNLAKWGIACRGDLPPNEIPNKRLLYGVRRTIGDRIVLEHPFALADVDCAELASRCQDALEELGMDGDVVFGRELEATVVDDRHNPLRNLVGLFLVRVALRRLALRGVIVADAPPRLVLGDTALDVVDCGVEQELRRHEPVHLLQPYRGRPRLGALTPPRLPRLKILLKVVHSVCSFMRLYNESTKAGKRVTSSARSRWKSRCSTSRRLSSRFTD